MHSKMAKLHTPHDRQYTGRMLSRVCFMLAVGLASSLSGGCVLRTLQITTEPAGALVYLNDQEVGRTPLAVPFTWYGTYDVRLERDGYQPMWTTGEAKMPWWELPGPDLIAEMIPGAESNVAWHYTLEEATPSDEVDTGELVGRAEALREDTRTYSERQEGQ